LYLIRWRSCDLYTCVHR